MQSAYYYRQKVYDLGIADLELRASSLAEAKKALQKCRALQKQLRQIKKEVNHEMKQIRAIYKDRIANAGSGMSTAFRVFGKRKLAGSISADAKRAERAERDRTLAPYDNIKHTIDDVIHQLDDAKFSLEQYIEEFKASEAATKQEVQASTSDAEAYCTQCGAQVGSTDKFCRNCGHQLR